MLRGVRFAHTYWKLPYDPDVWTVRSIRNHQRREHQCKTARLREPEAVHAHNADRLSAAEQHVLLSIFHIDSGS